MPGSYHLYIYLSPFELFQSHKEWRILRLDAVAEGSRSDNHLVSFWRLVSYVRLLQSDENDLEVTLQSLREQILRRLVVRTYVRSGFQSSSCRHFDKPRTYDAHED
jgi:hypothetical protein